MRWVVSILLFISIASAFADAREGELYGVTLSHKFPLTDQTLGRPFWTGYYLELVPEKQVKGEKIGQVRVLATLKSYTICKIFSETLFDDFEKARDFALKMREILSLKYDLKEWKGDDVLGAGSKIWTAVISDTARFEIDLVGDKKGEKPTVLISLYPNGQLEKILDATAKSEFKAARLDKSNEKDWTKGL